jgi:iron complex transport system substrate-binding protein
MRKLFLLSSIFFIVSCTSDTRDKAPDDPSGGHVLNLRYAEGFSIRTIDSVTWVEVKQPYQGATKGYTYLLVPVGKTIPAHAQDVKVIEIPLRSIVCTSTTHIPHLDYLGVTDKLVGFPTTDYISSEKARQRIDQGKVTDLGIDKGLNLEELAMIKPQLVMGYTMSSDYGQFKKIEELGIPVVINSEYLEKHPLGRAEWIKFVAAFFGKQKEADSVFHEIENNYLTTMTLAAGASRKPKVLEGIMYGGTWFLPGGQNYASKLLKDAGCDYLWSNDTSTGYLELSFESVYERAHNADLWIGSGPYSSLKDLASADHRYKSFRPFSTKMIFAYDAKKGAKGGNEYLELGYLRPDIILQDLVRIAHPELLPEYELYFHRRLE